MGFLFLVFCKKNYWIQELSSNKIDDEVCEARLAVRHFGYSYNEVHHFFLILSLNLI